MISDASMLAALQAAIDLIDGRKSIVKSERELLKSHLEAIRQRIIAAAAKRAERPPSPTA